LFFKGKNVDNAAGRGEKKVRRKKAHVREEGKLRVEVGIIGRVSGPKDTRMRLDVQDMPVYLCQHSGTHSIGRLNASQTVCSRSGTGVISWLQCGRWL